MRRRLSIGISLVADPAVLILDEPTTGLDPDTRSGLWKTINEASRERFEAAAEMLCNFGELLEG